MADLLVPWIVTYAVHSTVLLAVVFAITRIPSVSAAARETLWRTALFGGLVTAVTVSLSAVAPVAGTIEMPAPPIDVVQDPLPASDEPLPVFTPPAPHAPDAAPVVPSGVAPSVTRPPPAGAAIAEPHAESSLPIVPVFLGLWGAFVLVSVVRVLVARRRLHAKIGDRVPVTTGPAAMLLRQIVRRAGARPVRLTMTDGLESPIVLGSWRPEICVPRRALEVLPSEQIEAMLAHELAHVARRDGLWFLAARAAVWLFPFQPLNRLAFARLRDNAEVLCDAQAVAWTQHPVALAECLAEVAGWIVHERGTRLVPAMASGDSKLGDRVDRLLGDEIPRPGSRRIGRSVALALLLAVAIAAPAASIAASSDAEPLSEGAIATTDPVSAALAGLDAELRGLEADLDTLTDLAAEVDDPRVRAAIARIESQMQTLGARRAALVLETDR